MSFEADINLIKSDLATWPGKLEGRLTSYSQLVDKVAAGTASNADIVQGSAKLSLGAQADMAKVASIWVKVAQAYATLDI